MHDQSCVPFHRHKQCRIAEALDETLPLQDLRVMSLPTSTRIQRAIHALFSKPTYPRLGLFSRASLSFSFSSSGSSTNTRRTGTPWKCARLISYIARVRLPSPLPDCGRRTETLSRGSCFVCHCATQLRTLKELSKLWKLCTRNTKKKRYKSGKTRNFQKKHQKKRGKVEKLTKKKVKR